MSARSSSELSEPVPRLGVRLLGERGLRSRGLAGVRLCVSDQHEGLKAAIAKILGCPWQRCTAHFVRNMQGHCRRNERGLVAAALREIFDAPGDEEREEVVELGGA